MDIGSSDDDDGTGPVIKVSAQNHVRQASKGLVHSAERSRGG